MSYSQKDIERIKSYEKVHLRGVSDDLSTEERTKALKKKDRNKWFMILFNVFAIIFFSYSYFFDLTALSDTIYLILVVVFALNVALIFLQKRQIRELMEYYLLNDETGTI